MNVVTILKVNIFSNVSDERRRRRTWSFLMYCIIIPFFNRWNLRVLGLFHLREDDRFETIITADETSAVAEVLFFTAKNRRRHNIINPNTIYLPCEVAHLANGRATDRSEANIMEQTNNNCRRYNAEKQFSSFIESTMLVCPSPFPFFLPHSSLPWATIIQPLSQS